MENKVLEKILEELRIMNKLKAMEIANNLEIYDDEYEVLKEDLEWLENSANIIIKKIKTGM